MRAGGSRHGLLGAMAAALLAAGCQAGLNAGPDAAALNLELGAAYLAQGRLELARDKLLRATLQDSRSSEAHRLVGMAYERLEDLERAERHYRRAVRLAPRDVEALNSLGVFQCRAGKPQEGLKLLERAAREAVGIRRASVYANCGVCELPLDRNGAAEWFRRALALDPQNVEAQLLLERLVAQN
ncbi:MAG: tetratricopeptide repeat protein [Gammaproteobacteria bacterium]|nr:tetratricopeptide repeat protein [Gammaproteobacteria bacterium]